jgi:hypothetical protein
MEERTKQGFIHSYYQLKGQFTVIQHVQAWRADVAERRVCVERSYRALKSTLDM